MLAFQERLNQLAVLFQQVEPDLVRIMDWLEQSFIPMSGDDLCHVVNGVHQYHHRFRCRLTNKVGSRNIKILSHRSAIAICHISLSPFGPLFFSLLAAVCVPDGPF